MSYINTVLHNYHTLLKHFYSIILALLYVTWRSYQASLLNREWTWSENKHRKRKWLHNFLILFFFILRKNITLTKHHIKKLWKIPFLSNVMWILKVIYLSVIAMLQLEANMFPEAFSPLLFPFLCSPPLLQHLSPLFNCLMRKSFIPVIFPVQNKTSYSGPEKTEIRKEDRKTICMTPFLDDERKCIFF